MSAPSSRLGCQLPRDRILELRDGAFGLGVVGCFDRLEQQQELWCAMQHLLGPLVVGAEHAQHDAGELGVAQSREWQQYL